MKDSPAPARTIEDTRAAMGEWCTKFDASYKNLEGLIVMRDVTEAELETEIDALKKQRADYLKFDAFARTLKPRVPNPKAKAKAKAKANT